jgi:hypothetical protein
MEENNHEEKQTNSFKLIKNSRGYGWEIKVISDDPMQLVNLAATVDNQARAAWAGMVEA